MHGMQEAKVKSRGPAVLCRRNVIRICIPGGRFFMLAMSLLGLFAGLTECRLFFRSVAPSQDLCRFLCLTFDTCGDTASPLSKAALHVEAFAAGDSLHLNGMSPTSEKSTIPL